MTRRKEVTVARRPHAVTEAIEKSGLVNIESAGLVAATSITYTYVIVGEEPSTGDTELTIELTWKELNAVQKALGKAANGWRISDTDMLELLHLRTLLAEAAAPPKDTT